MSNQQIQPPSPIIPTIPVGTIVAFSGNPATIPSGWILCNDFGKKSLPTNYEGSQIPNLDGLTLIGQGLNYNFGEQGGESTHQLSTAEIPPHSHTIHGGDFGSLGTSLEIGDSSYVPYCTTNVFGANGTDISGEGIPHNNMQPFYVVYYIMFIGVSTSQGLYNAVP